ncbi:MAG: response regulator transcription factor [Dehalococcoidia bacterium]
MSTKELKNVLVVEDEPRSARLLAAILAELSDHVQIAADGPAALDALAEDEVDLVTLDIGLPGLSGIELLLHIRDLTNAPVIMVTAHGDVALLVEALAAGADDFIVKPVRPAEFIARARALLRRLAQAGSPAAPDRYSDDNISVDFGRNTVVTARGIATLTPTERRLLEYLIANPGRVSTQEELLRAVWGSEQYDLSNLHVYIGYLRQKLEPDPRRPQYIRTHRGIGYEFASQDELRPAS